LLQELTQEERDTVEKEVEELSGELQLKEWDVCVADDQAIVRLKEEIQEVRGSRAKMRSIQSSASSSVTIFPLGTPGSSPVEELATDSSSPEKELASDSSHQEELDQDRGDKEAEGIQSKKEKEEQRKEEEQETAGKSSVDNYTHKDS